VSERGLVADIQRASFRDGPGIRTTVFLKGCPLRCLWCHNPETQSPRPQLFFSVDRCVGCGACAGVCDRAVHRVGAGGHEVDFGSCDLCARCIGECNSSGLRIVGREMGVDEVMREVMADAEFYANSGGGVTLSGGEPLFQHGFATAILRGAQRRNVHTCVETSGFVAPDRFVEALAAVDLLLFDYKATDDGDHRAFTGVSNRLILDNLDAAYRRGKAIILRCPIVPGLNDTARHFAGIRALDERYPRLHGIELMPYHDFGNSKRGSVGLGAAAPALRVPAPEEPDGWVAALRALGCEKVRLG
jgi:pyruvate formate lyase activating enzyme